MTAGWEDIEYHGVYDPEELLPGYTPPVFAPITPVDDWREELA